MSWDAGIALAQISRVHLHAESSIAQDCVNAYAAAGCPIAAQADALYITNPVLLSCWSKEHATCLCVLSSMLLGLTCTAANDTLRETWSRCISLAVTGLQLASPQW